MRNAQTEAISNRSRLERHGQRFTISLARYHSFVDGRRLSELTRDSVPTVRSYLGVMLSLAIEAPDGAGRAPQYESALAHCKPLRRPRALYDNIEALPAFREWARTHSLPVYRRWGLWHEDVTLKLVTSIGADP